MKLSRQTLTFCLLAGVAVLAVAAMIGHPLVPPEAFVGIGMIPFAMSGEVGIVEIKTLVEELGKTHKQYRETNDELLKAKAEGKAVSDLEAKLAQLDKRMDGLQELKADLDKFILESQRPGGGQKDKEAVDAEAKTWNLMLRSDFQTKGRPAPAEVTTDEYVHYKSAFFALTRHGNIEKLSSEERKALSAGSDPDGGYLLPASTVGRMVKRVYERSVMRRLALVVPISTDALEGISDNDETDAGWTTEIGTRNDTDTPTVGKYRIQAEEMYAQPKVTQKLIDDAATDVEAWLADKIADKFARVEGTAFLQGTGVGQARGLCTYTTVTTDDDSRAWGQFQHVVTGANGAFHTDKADPLQTLLGAFRDEYLQNASWLMRREVRTLIRKMKEATSDRYLWEPSLQMGQPDRLLGYPVNIDQYMPTIATGSLSLAFGDIREAYTIVDRMGARTLRDPFTAKPYVRFYTTKRTGGGAVNFEAVKFLKFST